MHAIMPCAQASGGVPANSPKPSIPEAETRCSRSLAPVRRIPPGWDSPADFQWPSESLGNSVSWPYGRWPNRISSPLGNSSCKSASRRGRLWMRSWRAPSLLSPIPSSLEWQGPEWWPAGCAAVPPQAEAAGPCPRPRAEVACL